MLVCKTVLQSKSLSPGEVFGQTTKVVSSSEDRARHAAFMAEMPLFVFWVSETSKKTVIFEETKIHSVIFNGIQGKTRARHCVAALWNILCLRLKLCLRCWVSDSGCLSSWVSTGQRGAPESCNGRCIHEPSGAGLVYTPVLHSHPPGPLLHQDLGLISVLFLRRVCARLCGFFFSFLFLFLLRFPPTFKEQRESRPERRL